MEPDVLSTYKAAQLCNVHLTTIINWVNAGRLKAYTTPGGHRRIKLADLLEFMKKYGIPGPEGIRSEKRVLVVDDDTEALDELKEALRGQGFVLDFATDGFEAGRKVYGDKPDLILLDFKMPGMDGFQVCEILRKDKRTENIPIFAITVLDRPEDVARIKKSGVKEYISKPVDVAKLIVLIKKTLKI